MKKRRFIILGMVTLLFAACQSEDRFIDQVATEGEGTVSFTVSAPDALGVTRAYNAAISNSAKGGITNVDCTNDYDLRYQLAIYRIEGDGTFTEVITPQLQVVTSYAPVTYSFKLAPNKDYQVVAWADFVATGTTADLHYNTSDFSNITCLDAEDKQLNDESRDAYFVTKKVEVKASAISENIVLKRPFAKIRFITTDWGGEGLDMPDNFKITYKDCKRFTNINALTGDSDSKDLAASESTVYTGIIDKANKEYALGYDASDKNRTLVVDYLMTENSANQTPIHFVLENLNGAEAVSTYDFTTNIPIRRNFLTTIMGDLLSVGAEFNVSCDEVFEDEYNDYYTDSEFYPTAPAYDEATKTYTITSANELAWIAATSGTISHESEAENIGNLVRGATVKLANDIDMKGINWKSINYWDRNNPLTFDGGGNTIYNLRMDAMGGIKTGLFSRATANIKDLTVENATINYTSSQVGTIAGQLAGDIDNVTVKHVFIRVNNYDTTNPAIINVGGLVGMHVHGDLTDCTAIDVNIEGYHGIGGIVGKIITWWNVPKKVYTRCHVEKSTIWDTAKSGVGLMQVGSIFGYTEQNIDLVDCTETENTYKVYAYNDEKFVILTSDDIVDGNTTGYGPTNKLYGRHSPGKIVDITTTAP